MTEVPRLDVEQELEDRRWEVQEKLKTLGPDGRLIWKTLKVCIAGVLSEGSGHFERAFGDELEDAIAEQRPGASVAIARQSGAQWLVSITNRGRCTQYYASVRSETLGDFSEGHKVLNGLRDSARRVKGLLLQERASWLHALVNGERSEWEFLHACKYFDPSARSRIEERVIDSRTCHVCHRSLQQDHLGGQHHCRIVASFSCCGRWTSQRARYILHEDRVMGQKCQTCGKWGTPISWQLSTDSPGSGVPGDRAHLSHLCEACDRYGNCMGVFVDPFMLNLAVRSETGQRSVNWVQDKSRELWTTKMKGCVLVLVPHVHQSAI